MKWQAYPRYQDSGIKWIGEIPEHWETQRLKYIASLNDETLGETTNPDFQLLYVDISGVDAIAGIQHKEKLVFGDAPSRARRKVRHGDVIVSTVRTYLRAIAPVVEPEANLIVSTGFAVVRPMNELESQFALYALRAPYFVEEVVANSVGVSYPATNTSELATFFVALPPQDEQRAIAAFLDRETERIDALIARKERQVELLQEKRAALISHAVTKGLDPNAPMKDSGVEWLEEIPAHWTVCLFKRVADTAYGLSGELDRTLTEGTQILSLPNVDIDGNLLLDEVPFVHLPDEQKPEFLLQHGDLLFNWRNGSARHLGKTAFFDLEGEYTHVSFLLRLRFAPSGHDSRYFHRMLSGFRISGFFSSSKAGVNNTFNQSEINNLWVVVPPLEEQKDIADYLDRETEYIDTLVKKIRESIAKLREYRTALISAAVTGKIDVCQGGYDGI